ncbi:hypothetical protein Cgig2_024306 [Carnegiea gigantea]|uniref:Uncharacterized protein n=1 Tax=Carnegiea gigantea TaxID=171969 RepID=A0A9Q1GU12_9CARY|nr:hypothetical protein Cgig2_024306 [Carnegiea gigantea]
MAFPPFRTPKRWPTMLGKLSGGIEGLPRVLLVHSKRTTGTYVHVPLYPTRRKGFMAADSKVNLEGLQWSSFESCIHVNRHSPLERERERENPIMFLTFLSTEQAAEYVRKNFLWPLRESSILQPSLLPENHHSFYPNLDFLVAIRHGHSSHIPEMVQAIFYAMVLNDATELGLSSGIGMDCMTSALWELKWDVIES